MPMPPALAAALAKKNGGKKKSTFAQKIAAQDQVPSGPGDPNKGMSKAAAAKLAVNANMNKGKKKRGNLPPQFIKS